MQRNNLIKSCITEVSGIVGNLRQKRNENPDDVAVIRELRREQNKVLFW